MLRFCKMQKTCWIPREIISGQIYLKNMKGVWNCAELLGGGK